MKFIVSISPEASSLLIPHLRWKLARRAARKVQRMGSSSAMVVFPGPNDLRVIVDCLRSTIRITTAREAIGRKNLTLLRKSA